MIKYSAVLLAAGALTVAGCSSSSESSPSPSATPSSTSSSTIVGGDPSTWTPVMIDNNKAQSVVVGQALNVTTEGVTKVETTDSSVLTVSQPRTESSGGATFGPGANAVGVGTATLSVYKGDEKLYETVVTVAEYTPSPTPGS